MARKIREEMQDTLNEKMDDITSALDYIRALVEKDACKELIIEELKELEESLI